MKIRIFDLKINDRKHDATNDYRGMYMYLPTEDQAEEMIGWLQEYELEPYTFEHAIEVYVRTFMFYQANITYKMQLMADTVKASADDLHFAADIIDATYETYRKVNVKFILPDELILDTDNCITIAGEYDDDIELTIYNLLMSTLPITIESIKSTAADKYEVNTAQLLKLKLKQAFDRKLKEQTEYVDAMIAELGNQSISEYGLDPEFNINEFIKELDQL